MGLKKTFVFLCCIFLLNIGLSIKKVYAVDTWTKYTNNPIIDVGPPGSWDDNSVDSPAVILDGSIYKMWYGGHDGSNWRIGYATSPDGANWTKYENPVVDIDPSDSWEKDAHEPVVIYENGVYKMWYTSGNFTPTRGIEKWRIRYATSPDGVNWTKYPDPVLRGDQNGWDKEGITHPHVIRDGTVYKMWYPGRDVGDIWRMGYATSPDGVNWIKIINPLSEFNDPWVGGPSVLKIENSYSMWYHNSREIELATSSDGVLWGRSIENPVLSRGASGFDSSRLIAPFVIRRGNVYQMWYTGYDGLRWRIGYASTGVIPTPTPTPITSLLPVPYFSQRDPLWKLDEYDHANDWIKLGQENTIDWWGCALTSGAMVARYFGVDKTPYGEELTPKTLNKWMKDQNDANFRNGAMNWELLGRMTKYSATVSASPIPILNPSISDTPNNFAGLDEILQKAAGGFPGLPGILQVTNPYSPNSKHFVVVKGKQDTTYGINDPYNEQMNLLSISPYNNKYDRLIWYTPTPNNSPANLSTILLVVNNSANIQMLNSDGNVVGLQFDLYPPSADNENGGTSGEILKMLYLDQPPSGNYTVRLSAGSSETYQLNTYLYDKNAEVKMSTITGVIGQNNSGTVNVNFDQDNSQNSQTSRVVSFETLKEDINSSYLLGWIKNKDLQNYLLHRVMAAQAVWKNGNAHSSKNILKNLLNQIVAGKEKHPDFSNLLKGDLEILLSSL